VFGEIESTKSVSDLYAPAGGEIVAVNDALADDPASSTATPTARVGSCGSGSPRAVRHWMPPRIAR
jgi:hypothetical protein